MNADVIDALRPFLSTLLFVFWSLLHSIFADQGVKRRIEMFLGPKTNRWYRFVYVVISIISLSAVMVPVYLWPGEVLWALQGFPGIALSFIRFASLAGLLLTAVRTDMGDFLGLSHMAGKKNDDILVVSGAYSWVRHPLYSFGFVVIWSSPGMTAGALALSVAASLYLWLGSYHEEAGLRRVFGEQYIKYAEEVPRLIPSRPRNRR